MSKLILFQRIKCYSAYSFGLYRDLENAANKVLRRISISRREVLGFLLGLSRLYFRDNIGSNSPRFSCNRRGSFKRLFSPDSTKECTKVVDSLFHISSDFQENAKERD